GYGGSVFRIEERVLDPVSIIEELATPVTESTFQIDWETDARWDGDAIQLGKSGITIRAKRYIFAAGKGNPSLLEARGFSAPAMQTRPLHQVVIRKSGLPDFFSVCIGSTPKPPIVSTTHIDAEGRTVWYIGGDLAEADGVARTEAEQIQTAQNWFAKHMSWIDFSGAEWDTIRIDRAEPKTESGARPPGAFCEKVGENVIAGWPTKLALAPNFADQVLAILKADGISPDAAEEDLSKIALPRPAIGKPPWA
ncbi:MAG: FAD-dependent oxidoreductase, partial [Verrucomicrobiales bacterium]|nr:FAD-dependent oxidoreductase [Verrucomicrobiales bacterium]